MRRALASLLALLIAGPVLFGSLPQWQRDLTPLIMNATWICMPYPVNGGGVMLGVFVGMLLVAILAAWLVVVRMRRAVTHTVTTGEPNGS